MAKQTKKPVGAKGSTTAPESLKPFFLVPPSEGSTTWSLCLADAHSPIEVFEAAGHSGNGYAWDSVARVVAKQLTASQRRRIGYNSEAGTFVANGADADTLRTLGGALAALVRDPAALARSIAAVPEDDWDD